MRKNSWVLGIVIFVLIFIATAVIFQIYEFSILPSHFFGALFGVVITAIITVFLLQGQTANEEEREKSVRVFERKQDVYEKFLEQLRKIIHDGKISITAKNNGDDTHGTNVGDLKDLIFHLGYMQMHASEKTINGVLDGVARMIKLMNDFSQNSSVDNKRSLTIYYATLSGELFKLVTLLKEDLYHKEQRPVSRAKMNAILKECDLFVGEEEQ